MRRFLFLFLIFSSFLGAADFEKHIKYNPDGENTIGRIYIGGRDSMIDESTWIYVKSALDHYKQTKPPFIILELNTPGGMVFSAGKISDALKDMDTNHNIPVIAFIDSWAISAGALLAYSCRFISITEDASMGAAEPVIATGTEMKSASEKINSALRADFSNAAMFFDRNPLIAEAMVDNDVILVMRDGKITKLEKDEDIKETDEIIIKKDKLLTLNAKEMVKHKVADIALESKRVEEVTESEKSNGKWPASKSLLFTHPFFAKIPNATIDTFKLDWKLLLLSFLSKPAVASLLFLGLMLGFYLELNTPGFGLPGSVGLTCLFLIILSHFSFEAASWLEVIILLVGLVLIGVEVFVLPGFGFVGVIGGILCIGGLFALMLPAINEISFEWDSGTFNAAGEFFFERLLWLSGTLILGIVLMVIMGKYVMPKWGLFQRFVLVGDEEDASEGFVAVGVDVKIGATGEALTPLRPAGKAEIDGEIQDVISEGAFIKQGEKVVVISLDGGKIIVKEGSK